MANTIFGPDIEAPARDALTRSLDGMDRTIEMAAPAMKSMLLAQAHMTGFAVKRTRAMMALPRQAAACRTPQDVWSLQMNFWQTAMAQYVEASQAVMGAMVPAAAPRATRQMPTRKAQYAPSANACLSAHDVIAFPSDRARPSHSD